MKQSNTQNIAARLADAGAKLAAAGKARDSLATQRESAALTGLDALRAHNAKLAEATDLVAHLEATVRALDAEHEASATAEYEAACAEAYAKVKAARATVVERVTHHREKIATMNGELRQTVREAEADITEINRHLPPGAMHLMPLEYALRREPRGSIVGPDDPDFWFYGAPDNPAASRKSSLKLVRPVKPKAPETPPVTQWAPGYEPGRVIFAGFDRRPEPVSPAEDQPAPNAEITVHRSATYHR